MRPLCIYHGNCLDGFTAAWVVNKFFKGEVELYPGVYQNPPPEVEQGRIVIFVDFSYKREVMAELLKKCAGILILDHHKSAIEDLKPIVCHVRELARIDNESICWETIQKWISYDIACNDPEIYALFDLDKSGAGLAWDFFNPGIPREPPIDYVEDRDLWRFKLPNSREVNASLFSYEYDLEIWDSIMYRPVSWHVDDGIAIERKHHKDVRELTKVVTRMMCIDGHVVPVANLPYTYTSDAGHLLSNDKSFAACYWDTPEGRVFSLRSRDDGMDVSAIAKKYGGGGHRNAAGFRVPFSHIHEFEVSHVSHDSELDSRVTQARDLD